mgnify:CR=1 FL=1
MTTTRIRELCEEAIRDDERATKGPWFNSYSHIDSAPLVKQYDAAERLIPDDAPDDDPRWALLPETRVADVPVVGGDTPTAQGGTAAEFIANARTREPQLARMLLMLLPLVRHAYNNENGEGCAHYIDERESCDCGLDAALKSIE